MHLSIAAKLTPHAPTSTLGIAVGVVAFELNGQVLEPHELLQIDDRWMSIYFAAGAGETPAARDRLVAFAAKWLGQRGVVWTGPSHGVLLSGLTPPWTAEQEHSLGTLLWLAKRVPKNFRLPDMSAAGFLPGNALHEATESAVYAQAAYRALIAAQPVPVRRGTLPPSK